MWLMATKADRRLQEGLERKHLTCHQLFVAFACSKKNFKIAYLVFFPFPFCHKLTGRGFLAAS